jgi:hypothetical protein
MRIEVHSFIMKKEATGISETLVSTYLTTRRHVLEDRDLNSVITVSFKRNNLSSITQYYFAKILQRKFFKSIFY